MRGLKIAAYVIGGLIALVVLLLVGVALFVNPNNYRGEIADLVKKQTGRELTLTGDLHLSVFPWIALGLGPASLSDAPGFGPKPFASIQEAKVSVKLLPLLRGKLEVGNVRLAGVEVRLITDVRGRHNWSDLAKPQAANAPQASSSSGTQFDGIGGVEIERATITVDDALAGTHQALRDFYLKTGAIGSGQESKVETHFTVQQSADTTATVKATTTVAADFDAKRYQLKDANFEIDLTGKGLPAKGLPIQLQAAKADADIAAQTLTSEGLVATVAGVKTSLAVKGTEILDAPKFAGKISIAPVSLRDVLPKVGMTVPVTSDPKVLTQLAVDADISATKTSASLENVVLKLDDTTMKGSLGIADFAAQALRFNLNVDRINVDRYRAPPAKEPVNEKAAAPAAPTDIPVDALRKLNARGTFKIGQAIFSNLKFENLELNVNARDGDVKLAPMQASMYGGRYKGNVGIDATQPVAALAMDADVSDVNFAPLFKDMFKTEKISGKGHASAKLNARGKTTDAWFKSLSGNIDFKVADGALEGTDLWYEIRRARALIKQQPLPSAPSPVRTAFTSLQGTGKVTNGVLANDDLVAATQYLRINGQGSVDLVESTLDYRLNTVVLKIPQEAAVGADDRELVDAEIPVRVTGTLSSPKVRPDVEAYLRGAVKKKVEDKLRDKLKDKLKGILGGH